MSMLRLTLKLLNLDLLLVQLRGIGMKPPVKGLRIDKLYAVTLMNTETKKLFSKNNYRLFYMASVETNIKANVSHNSLNKIKWHIARLVMNVRKNLKKNEDLN